MVRLKSRGVSRFHSVDFIFDQINTSTGDGEKLIIGVDNIRSRLCSLNRLEMILDSVFAPVRYSLLFF